MSPEEQITILLNEAGLNLLARYIARQSSESGESGIYPNPFPTPTGAAIKLMQDVAPDVLNVIKNNLASCLTSKSLYIRSIAEFLHGEEQ